MKRICWLLLCICILFTMFPLSTAAFQTNYTGISVQVGKQTLPLAEYPVGGKCQKNSMYYPLPDGGTVCVYGYECYGFARYVFYRCFGVVDCTFAGGKGYYSVVSNVKPSTITTEYLKNILGTKVLAGAHIRVDRSGVDGHSMVFLYCDSQYVYTYEGNYDSQCGVTVNQRTWDEFVAFCKKRNGIEFIHMPDQYPDSGCPDCPGADFSDMPRSDHWSHAGLHFMLENGLFAGTSATTISPTLLMNRAMMVTVLWRLQGAAEAQTESPFADVTQTDWFKEAVVWAAENGVASGIGDGNFGPKQTITREQIAVMLHGFAANQTQDLPPEDTAILQEYPDGDTVSEWATESMAWAVSNGLLSGKKMGDQILLDPLAEATRAEVAAIIMQLCTQIDVT